MPKEETLIRRQLQQEAAAAQNRSYTLAGIAQTGVEVETTTGNDSAQLKVFARNVFDVVVVLLPAIDDLLVQMGLPNQHQLAGKTQEEINKLVNETACKNTATLTKVLETRNKINEVLIPVARSTQIVEESLQLVRLFFSKTINTITFVQAIKQVASQAAKFVPPGLLPGAVPALLSDTQFVIDTLLYNSLGSPKLANKKAQIDLMISIISGTAIMIKQLLDLISILDVKMKQCNVAPTPAPAELFKLVAAYAAPKTNTAQTSYKGFRLSIVEEPFSERLTKKKAVAYNQSGIPLLETQSSFTTLPEILLKQLQYLIDQQQLKSE